MTVVREASLVWWDDDGDPLRAKPLHDERVNRQFARNRILRETGAIQLVRTDSLRSNAELVGRSHYLFETHPEESLDINSIDDLAAARRRLEKGIVVLRIRANRRIGYGHFVPGNDSRD